jgi:hypothetical protein
MKKIIISLSIVLGSSFCIYAGNGKGNGNENTTWSCNCPNEINMYAAGKAQWLPGNQIKCNGQTGTCWEISYTENGWELTIYSNPPLVLGNSYGPDDSPVAPQAVEQRENYILYEVDRNVWRKNK